ncbi:MAG: hypothetical protein UT85_C0025G0003 [Candidatus Levybacteria bacterium GW2011_GWA2_40_16]|nr:MAG: hypothetical protein UT85_C0025G0003 [Candidatus Levybacteria bacterium GW2011_GWA2_40_16]
MTSAAVKIITNPTRPYVNVCFALPAASASPDPAARIMLNPPITVYTRRIMPANINTLGRRTLTREPIVPNRLKKGKSRLISTSLAGVGEA